MGDMADIYEPQQQHSSHDCCATQEIAQMLPYASIYYEGFKQPIRKK
jgi:hypothetical protein